VCAPRDPTTILNGLPSLSFICLAEHGHFFDQILVWDYVVHQPRTQAFMPNLFESELMLKPSESFVESAPGMPMFPKR
jgi:hypothetical protein